MLWSAAVGSVFGVVGLRSSNKLDGMLGSLSAGWLGGVRRLSANALNWRESTETRKVSGWVRLPLRVSSMHILLQLMTSSNWRKPDMVPLCTSFLPFESGDT
mmetsp:Transcript_613/g.1178  ORF Transcript_613/g.1178 Transcript_613/m.1178 type:complete len:102 (-) Transcript_613:117-422(-)